MRDPDREAVLHPAAHHSVFALGSGYAGWWVGTLRRDRKDYWECGHQHETRAKAVACAQKVMDCIDYISDPIRWRPAPKRKARH